MSKEAQDIMRELMVLNADYNDLVKKLDKLSERIHTLYEQADKKLNGKEQK